MRKLSLCYLLVWMLVRHASGQRRGYEIDMFLEDSSSSKGKGGKTTKGPGKESKTKAPGFVRKKYVKLAKDSKSTKKSRHDMLPRHSLLPSMDPSVSPTFGDQSVEPPTNAPITSSPTFAPTRAAANSQQQTVPTRAASRTPTFTGTVTVVLQEFEICFDVPMAPSSSDVDEVVAVTASYLNVFFLEYVPHLTRLETQEVRRSTYDASTPFCIWFEATATYDNPGKNNIMDETSLTQVLSLALGGGFLQGIQSSLDGSNTFKDAENIYISEHLGPKLEQANSESSSKNGFFTSAAIGGALLLFGVSLLVHQRRKRSQDQPYGGKLGEISLADDTHAETFYTSAASIACKNHPQMYRDDAQHFTPHAEEGEAQCYHAGDEANCIDFEDTRETGQHDGKNEFGLHEFETGSSDDETSSVEETQTIGDMKISLRDGEPVIDWANDTSVQGSQLFPSSLFDEMADENVIYEVGERHVSADQSSPPKAQQSAVDDTSKESCIEQSNQTNGKQDDPRSWPSLQSRIESLRAYASGRVAQSQQIKRQDSDKDETFLPPSLRSGAVESMTTKQTNESNASEDEDEDVPMRVIDLIHKFTVN